MHHKVRSMFPDLEVVNGHEINDVRHKYSKIVFAKDDVGDHLLEHNLNASMRLQFLFRLVDLGPDFRGFTLGKVFGVAHDRWIRNLVSAER